MIDLDSKKDIFLRIANNIDQWIFQIAKIANLFFLSENKMCLNCEAHIQSRAVLKEFAFRMS